MHKQLTTSKPIRLLIVDDSSLMRMTLKKKLSADASIDVVGMASNGKDILKLISDLKPNIIILDLEMPEVDGLMTLSDIRKSHAKLPVIVCSSLTLHGSRTATKALLQGATDIIEKPNSNAPECKTIDEMIQELIVKMKSLLGIDDITTALRSTAINTTKKLATTPHHTIQVIVIGSSTGGPFALMEIIPKIPKNFRLPILIVQHMPPVFTANLAESLTKASQIPVSEATDFSSLVPGSAVIAPGGYHMIVEKDLHGTKIRLNTQAAENSCRPAVDVLLRSIANTYGANSLTVILTGMGCDGMKGCMALKEKNAAVYVQDEKSSVIWGMPGSVAKAGMADKILPLSDIASEILKVTKHQL